MTDFEKFREMIKDTPAEDAPQFPSGGDLVITFRVQAGIAGSTDGYVDAYFDRGTGKFLAFHWCD